MSISAKRKEVAVRFADFSGGVNYSEDSTRINNNQVQDCKNAILRKNGAARRPGCSALAGFDIVKPITGMHNYLDFTGTERIVMGSDGKVYTINATSGASTLEYTIGGTGKFRFCDSLGKVFATNGTKVVKGEGGDWFPVGIETPTGASAAASNSATGSLPAGVYEVYVGYGRDVGGTIVLYGSGQYLGSITVTAPDDSITISNFALSTDAQVNKRVVWMSDAGGATIYQYYTTTNTGSTTVVVENDTAKQVSLIYSALAVNNVPVPAFEYIHAGDGRIWGSKGNRLYFSLRNTSNAYDLERFFPLNFIDFPHEIEGIFSVGQNLYVNTPAGIYTQPSHDVTARTVWVEKRWRFTYMSTVVDYAGGKIGLTNDGVKFFDGEKFYDYDISEAIKKEISKMYLTTAGFEPWAIIYRRDIRTEYHICYNDAKISTATNNRRMVLNLDKLAYYPDKTVSAPWELWTNGATHMVAQQNGIVYHAQSHATAPKLYKEEISNTVDNGIYLDDGTIGTSASKVSLLVTSRSELLDMSARCSWNILRTMARVNDEITIKLFMRDVEGLATSREIGSGAGVSLWDVFEWDVGSWASSTPVLSKKKLPMNLHSYMMYIAIEQTADDPDFNVLDVVIEGIATVTRFT
jgi:hypothetical protein